MAKVDFKRVSTNAEVENIDIKDGQFIVTGEGKSFVDFGSQRKPIAGTPDTEMSDTSTNSVENKVIKEYVDSEIVNIKEYDMQQFSVDIPSTTTGDNIPYGTFTDSEKIVKTLNLTPKKSGNYLVNFSLCCKSTGGTARIQLSTTPTTIFSKIYGLNSTGDSIQTSHSAIITGLTIGQTYPLNLYMIKGNATSYTIGSYGGFSFTAIEI